MIQTILSKYVSFYEPDYLCYMTELQNLFTNVSCTLLWHFCVLFARSTTYYLYDELTVSLLFRIFCVTYPKRIGPLKSSTMLSR